MPSFCDVSRRRPRENTNMHTPPRIILPLNKIAELGAIPKSLRAFFSHENQGETAIASPIPVKIMMGRRRPLT